MSNSVAAFVSLERRIESVQAEINALNLEIQAFKKDCPSYTREFLPRHEALPDLESHVVREMEDLRGKSDHRSIYMRSLLITLSRQVAGVASLIGKYTDEKRKD